MCGTMRSFGQQNSNGLTFHKITVLWAQGGLLFLKAYLLIRELENLIPHQFMYNIHSILMDK